MSRVILSFEIRVLRLSDYFHIWVVGEPFYFRRSVHLDLQWMNFHCVVQQCPMEELCLRNIGATMSSMASIYNWYI